MRVLVTAASRHGATAELATEIGARLRETRASERSADTSIEVDVRPVDAVEGIDGYDAVVLGSAVYLGQWLDAARDWAAAHAEELSQRPVWLFSSGPVGAPLKPDESHVVDISSIAAALSPVEHRVFPGKIDRLELGFAERAVVRALRVPEGDFRDWVAVRDWAAQIAEHLSARESAVATA